MPRKKLEKDFYHRVYDVVKRVPIGRVTTYGAIAKHLGLRSSARLVGHALNAVGDDMEIPCHRVVNRNGELTGKRFFATPTLMRELLESEGVKFSGEGVIMEDQFWDPSEQPARRKSVSRRDIKTPR